MSERSLLDFISSHKSLVIVPDTSLDSLLTSGILMKSLAEHGWDVGVCLDAKILVDYPNDPAILINLIPASNKQVSIESSTEKGSSAALAVSLLDSMFGADTWFKLLAVIGGFYRNYYNFKQGGFRGLENNILNELIQSKHVSEAPALRLWGVKRKGFVTALARTLMPILPGISGMPDKALKIAETVFRGQNPYTIRQKEIKGDDVSKALLKSIIEIIQDYSLAIHLFGDFYIMSSEIAEYGEVEMSEVVGSITVYTSLCKNCPYDVILTPFDKSRIPQILSIYDDVADDVAEIVAEQYVSAKNGEVVESGEIIERPDIFVDVLMYINTLPKNRPVKVLIEGKSTTVLRELLRTGVKPDKAYTMCEPDQLCYL